jgi:hypothetical protein
VALLQFWRISRVAEGRYCRVSPLASPLVSPLARERQRESDSEPISQKNHQGAPLVSQLVSQGGRCGVSPGPAQQRIYKGTRRRTEHTRKRSPGRRVGQVTVPTGTRYPSISGTQVFAQGSVKRDLLYKKKRPTTGRLPRLG